METKRKWFFIGLILFLLPEIIWSPLLNFNYSIFESSNKPTVLRQTYLTNPDNTFWLIVTLILQTLGLFITSITYPKGYQNKLFSIIVRGLLGALLIDSIIVTYAILAIKNGIG